MENPGWAGGMDEKGLGEGAEYGGSEAPGGVDGSGDVGYLYAGGQPGHADGGAGNGY